MLSEAAMCVILTAVHASLWSLHGVPPPEQIGFMSVSFKEERTTHSESPCEFNMGYSLSLPCIAGK